MDFLNGLFLAAAAAALVPIIIHLVQRRRVRQVVFGSLRLLRKTPHRVVQRRRFEELLLVVLRALALAGLAVAFARPFFERRHERRAGAAGEAVVGEEAVLVLVDNSYSMRADGRLERARREALKLLRDVDPAAKVGVAAFNSQLDELCPVGSKIPRAEEAIRGIGPSWRATRLALALKQADRVLTRAGRSEARRRIVLIGDFQETSWKDPGAWTLSPGVELTVRNVAAKTVPNVLVGRLAVPRLVVAGGFVEVISAAVRNLTDKPLSDTLVTFRIDGKQKATRSLSLRPGAEAPVRFRHEFAEPGDVTGSMAVRAADDLPDDNVAYFCVHVTPRVRVLLVNADSGEKMVRNAGLFIRSALVPEVGGVVSPFEVRQVAPDRMRPADLDGVDVVLFVNVCRLPAEMTAVPPERRDAKEPEFHSPLGRFVASGGGIGLVCGSKVAPDEFNRTFGGLAPCRLSRPAAAKGDPAVVINQVDLRHEIFAEFARPHSGDFSLAEFSQYFLVTDSLRARVPARFSHKDAHPAVLERAFGEQGDGPAGGGAGTGDGQQRPKGKSILLTSSLDLAWNNLCLKSVFVPFVHQLTKRLCSRRTGSVRNFAVGDEVTFQVPDGAGDFTLRRMADRPAGAGESRKQDQAAKVQWEGAVALKARPGGGVVRFSPDRPGIYELAYTGGSARFAINLDPAEPDFRPLDTKLLLTAVRKGPALAAGRASGAASVAAKATARERMEARQRLWQVMLAAVLIILAVEMLLALRIGRA